MNMDNPIKILMSKRDADQVQKIFDKDDDPNFTIINRVVYDEGNILVELVCDMSLHLWSLAKRVEMWNNHEDEMKKLAMMNWTDYPKKNNP